MAAFSLLAVSCQEEIAYTAGEPDLDGCYGVYFPTQEASGSHTVDPSEAPEVNFTVKRLEADGEIVVPVNVTVSEEGIFNVSELKFADGQTDATLKVTFAKAKPGVEYSLTLDITDPQYALVYGQNPTYLNYSVIIEKYDLLGTAVIREGLITGYQQNPTGIEWKVEVYTKETNPGWYYFKDAYISAPFNQGWEENDGWNMIPSGSYLSINAENPSRVYMPFQNLGCSWGYGWMYAGSIAPEAGISGGTPAYGTLVNGVISFPANGMLFAETEYNDMELFLTNTTGAFRICLPGAVLTDYSMSLKAGFSEDGQQPVSFKFGADLQTIRYAAYAGVLGKEELQEKVNEVAADANAAVVAKPAADEEGNVPAAVVNLSFEKTGVYTLVAVGYDKNNAPQNTAAIVLEYVAAGDEVPVMVSAGLASADKYVPLGLSPETAVEFYIYGKDIVTLKMGLFASSDLASDYQGCVDALLKSQSAPADVMEQINGGVYVDVLSGLTPGTEYYLLVYASNGYEETLLVTDPLTTAGDPLPVYQSYSVEDISEDLMPATSEGFFGTWNYYAKDLYAEVPQTLRNYQGQVTVSDSEMPDIPAEEDPNGYGLPTEYVDVKGLFADKAEYWGFDDTMPFEFYGGVLYTVAWGFDASESGYYPASMYSTPAGSLNFYKGTMVGAYVSEGYVAFVDCTGGQILPELYLGMFEDEAYSSFSGVGAGYSDLLLINPENDDNGLAPEAAASAMSVAELDNLRFSLASDVNYVETERGRIRSAIDRAKASKRTPQAVGNVAGVEGEWEAPAVEFRAEDAGHIQIPVSTPVYKKASNAAQKFIR